MAICDDISGNIILTALACTQPTKSQAAPS
jgi:hypothetical protein